MALNRLQNYNWEQGTLTNPVNLSGEEMSGLIELALRSSINSDVRGYIHPISSISSYQEWVLNTKYPNLVLVNATIVDTEYSLLFENNATTAYINEGNRIRLVPLNIGLEALKFRIYSHAITTDNVASEETIRGRVSIDDENGYVVVGAAQENSSWSDTVMIQALPVYQEWDDGVHIPKELTLSISAVKVTSAAIIVPSVAKPSTAISGNITLSQHTKPIITGGSNTGNGVFVVPKIGDTVLGTGSDGLSFSLITPTEGTYAISCDVYLFSTSVIGLTATPVNIIVMYPYIQITVTTDGTFSDISTANPKVTLKRTVRPDGSAVSSADQELDENKYVLNGVVSGSSLIYTLGSGSIVANGVETFSASIDLVRSYEIHNLPSNITPNGVINNIASVFEVFTPSVNIVKVDGSRITYEEFIQSFQIPQDAVAIEVVSQDCSYLIDLVVLNKAFYRYSKTVQDGTFVLAKTKDEAILDKNGYIHTVKVLPIYAYDESDYETNSAPNIAYGTTRTINGKNYKGYIPAFGELYDCVLNYSEVYSILNQVSGNPTLTANESYLTTTLAAKDTPATPPYAEDNLFIKTLVMSGTSISLSGTRRSYSTKTIVFLKEVTQ